MEAHIIHNPDGTEVKEWYAIASYLEAMGTVSEDYGDVSGRKVIVDSKSPVALLKNANRVTMAVIAVVLLLILLIVLIIRLVVKIVRKRKSK